MRKLHSFIAITSLLWFAICECSHAQTNNPITIYLCKKRTYTAVTTNNICELLLSEDGKALTVGNSTYNISDIDSITFALPLFPTQPEEETSSDSTETVEYGNVQVIYDNDTAYVKIPSSTSGVTSTVNGANVILSSNNSAEELTYEISGTSDNGSLVYYGSYKCSFILNNLNLTSANGAAIDIQCGKRIALVLPDSTSSTLCDTAEGTHKATLYCKGHMEIEGGGSLTVTGNTKHAISTKEYLELKKTTGKITVDKAVTDGIHAGQYFLMKGGSVSVSNVGGDAIQAEITDDVTDELNGQMIINGGSIEFAVSGEDMKGLKSDSCITINGGTIKGTLSGNATKGIRCGTDLIINDGTIELTLSGTPVVTDYDPSYCAGIKARGYVSNGGSISITASGTANKGISTDSLTTFNGGTFVITTTGDGGTYNNSASTTDTYTSQCISCDTDLYILGGNFTLKSTGTGGKCVKVDGILTIGSEDSVPVICVTTTGSALGSSNSGGRPGGNGGGRPGGGWNPGGTSSSSDTSSNSKAIKSQGELIVNNCDMTISTATEGAEGLESKTKVTINGGDIYAKCYDDCINSAGQIIFNGGRTYCWATKNDAIDSNSSTSGAITLNGGAVFALSSNGAPEEGIDCDNAALAINGGYLFTMGAAQSNAPSVPTSSTAKQPTALLKSMSLTSGQYMSVFDNSGTTLFTLKIPFTYSSSYSVITCPEFVKGSNYTVKVGASAPTGTEEEEWNGFSIGGKSSATTTKKTISFTSNYVAL